MFILEKPYVSEQLKRVVAETGEPVLDNSVAREALAGLSANLLPAGEFAALARSRSAPRLYSNSENGLGFVGEYLAGTELARQVALFKDKAAFRDLLADIDPDFAYARASLEELAFFDPGTMPKPFIAKPSVGFFSLGVHVVDTDADWPGVAAAIKAEAKAAGEQYPSQVLDTSRFILEQAIEGEEFAVDVYFDEKGRPVILNILAHLFASDHDVSDRVYVTSAEIVGAWRGPLGNYLARLGELASLANFPAHVELRVDDSGRIRPIEVNPLRFAGWCVADLATHAYGIDPYRSFLEGRVPDWDKILPEVEETVTGVVVADIAPDIDRSRIARVDYEAFKARFSNPLELRKIDWSRYSVFAFLFAQARRDDLSEFKAILASDLKEFMAID